MGLASFSYELWKAYLMMAENSYDVPLCRQVMEIYLNSCDSTLVDDHSVSLTTNLHTCISVLFTNVLNVVPKI